MFSDLAGYLWLIPVLPLLGAVVISALGRRVLREQSHWPCILGAVGACVLSLMALTAVANGHDHGGVQEGLYRDVTWFRAGTPGEPGAVHATFSMRADGLTTVMLVMITFIGSLIAIYSAGYMHGDPGYPRFFAAFSGFLFFMTGLVLANNFVLLYACWEGVGLCSFLLIGYWFQRPSAAAAARKAFLVTRLGDIGLFLGIMVLWANFGYTVELDQIFAEVNRQHANGTLDHGLIVTACLLLLVGAVGKSAQFPLHVWLPDAMEGPTPVSALIHAATMVTAGVYLVARCTPLFALAPEAQQVVGILGGITALLAALIALTQTDLKRVMAYSTLSQLGYMFMGLGAGLAQKHLVAAAVVAAVFHLFTHAFFKALLFLASGSVMHSMGDVIDMRRFGGLRRVLPTTHWTFLCGAGALSGFPIIFSGFWSKDEILSALSSAGGGEHGEASTTYLVLFIVGLVTAGLTAFYTGRAYFLTFWGEERIPPEAYSNAHGGHHAAAHADEHGHAAPAHGHHGDPALAGQRDHGLAGTAGHGPSGEQAEAAHLVAHTGGGTVHDAPPVMAIPLMILAVGAVVVGPVLALTGAFGNFLHHHWMEPTFPAALVPHGEHHHNYFVMALSSVMALAGLGLAYWMYVLRPGTAGKLAAASAALYETSRNRFYIDEIYDLVIVRPLTAVAHVARIVDQYLIDGLVDLVGQGPAFLGYLFRPIQNGLVQFYALLMALGMAGVLLSVLLR